MYDKSDQLSTSRSFVLACIQFHCSNYNCLTIHYLLMMHYWTADVNPGPLWTYTVAVRCYISISHFFFVFFFSRPNSHVQVLKHQVIWCRTVPRPAWVCSIPVMTEQGTSLHLPTGAPLQPQCPLLAHRSPAEPASTRGHLHHTANSGRLKAA